MWIKNILLTVASLSLAFMLTAQTDSLPSVTAIRPVTEMLSARVGASSMANTYLTPMGYDGFSVGLEFQRYRLSPSLRWTNWQMADIAFAEGTDPGAHGRTWSGRLRYRYGRLFTWRSESDVAWSAAVGPYAGVDLGFDYNLKLAASNNPATARVTANAGSAFALSARAPWSFARGSRLVLEGHLPLLGAALMPEYGASYYETFYLQNTANNVHFTSLHNQQDLDVQLSLDVPVAIVPWFRCYDSVLRLGWKYHVETMAINHIQTRYRTSEFVLGWVWQYLPYGSNRSHLLKRSAHEVF